MTSRSRAGISTRIAPHGTLTVIPTRPTVIPDPIGDLLQKHSETVAGTLKLDGTCDGFPIKTLHVYLINSSCRFFRILKFCPRDRKLHSKNMTVIQKFRRNTVWRSSFVFSSYSSFVLFHLSPPSGTTRVKEPPGWQLCSGFPTVFRLFNRLYSVADSIFFMLPNMKMPDTTQIAMSTAQMAQSGMRIQSRPGTDTR